MFRRSSEKGGAESTHRVSMTSEELERQNSAGNQKAPVFPLKGPRYGQRLSSSFKRWWWLWLLVLVAVVLIIVLPLLYVGFPNIAQSGIDGASLSIDGMRVTQATPDSFRLEINSTIRSTASQHPNLDAFDGALYLENDPKQQPFAIVHFPAVQAQAETPVNVSQTIQITDQTRDAFINYNKHVLLNETYRVTVDGHARLHYLAFPDTTVHFKHTAETKGLNAFRGLTTSNLKVTLAPDARGDNFHADVHIPNPSNLEVHIGNTTFVNTLDGKEVGFAYVDDFVLYPGNNTIPIRAAVQQAPILTALTSQPHCTTGILPTVFTGQSVQNAQGQTLPYFQEALRLLPVLQDLDVGTALSQAAGGLRVTCQPAKSSSSSS